MSPDVPVAPPQTCFGFPAVQGDIVHWIRLEGRDMHNGPMMFAGEDFASKEIDYLEVQQAVHTAIDRYPYGAWIGRAANPIIGVDRGVSPKTGLQGESAQLAFFLATCSALKWQRHPRLAETAIFATGRFHLEPPGSIGDVSLTTKVENFLTNATLPSDRILIIPAGAGGAAGSIGLTKLNGRVQGPKVVTAENLDELHAWLFLPVDCSKMSNADQLRQVQLRDSVTVEVCTALIDMRPDRSIQQYLLALAGIDGQSSWREAVAQAATAKRLDLLAFIVHSCFGDETPRIVRQYSKQPDWRALAEATITKVASTGPKSLRESRANWNSPQVNIAEFIGLLVWITRPSSAIPKEVSSRIDAAIAVEDQRLGFEQGEVRRPPEATTALAGVSIDCGGLRFAATDLLDMVQNRTEIPWQVALPCAAAWLGAQPEFTPEIVHWLLDGLGLDAFRGGVLRHMDYSLLVPTMNDWVRAKQLDCSAAAFAALVNLELVQPRMAGSAIGWAQQHLARLSVWPQELLARKPDEIKGDGTDTLRAQRRVLERMDALERTAWVAAHRQSPLIAALPGAAPPRYPSPLWFEILSPDATIAQFGLVQDYADRKNRNAEAALRRIGVENVWNKWLARDDPPLRGP